MKSSKANPVPGTPREIGCDKAQRMMSAFVDSTARTSEVERLEAHLAVCDTCQRQLQALISVKNLLRSADEPSVPQDLPLAIRIRLSHEHRPRLLARVGHRLQVLVANSVQPFALPAVTGVCLTLLFFGVLLQNMASYKQVQVSNSTLNRIERFSPVLRQPVTIEALINVQGKVYAWVLVDGPENDPEIDRWLENLLYVAQFRPATLFGRPMDSKLIMSFLEVS